MLPAGPHFINKKPENDSEVLPVLPEPNESDDDESSDSDDEPPETPAYAPVEKPESTPSPLSLQEHGCTPKSKRLRSPPPPPRPDNDDEEDKVLDFHKNVKMGESIVNPYLNEKQEPETPLSPHF